MELLRGSEIVSRIYWNNQWQFTEQFSKELLEEKEIAELKQVRLPHTCKETPYHYFDEKEYQMISGYRKVLYGEKSWKEKRIFLTFEGVAHEATVYCNGAIVGTHACGYTAFSVELTQYLKLGENNLIAVRVDSRENLNIPPFGNVIDYMTYGGIYREVYLEIREKVYIEDIFVKTKLQQGHQAQLWIENTLSSQETGYEVCCFLRKRGSAIEQLLGTQSGNSSSVYQIEEVEEWDIEHPVLYELHTKLQYKGECLEEKITVFGFRECEFRADGCYLNGKKIKLRGLNRHQSYPYVGYAMPASMQRYDADILKNELAVNAVRTSHYPQSQEFINRCDELGILVFTEIPGWQHIGDAAWKEQAVKNVEEMVLQYRNHPSIILWGVRINESGDDDAFYRRTNETAHRLDDSRQTGGVRAHKKSSLLEDVYTYNDFSHEGNNAGCEPKKKVTSDNRKSYLISEYNGHMFPTKNFDCEEHRVEHSLRHARVLDAAAGETDIAGCFGWCMFDYNTHKDFGSGDRICYHGVMDMFRNPKLAAYVYASQSEHKNVMELGSTMDIGEHPGCNRRDTYIFTNADSVRMYKNDQFIREFQKSDSQFKHLSHGPICLDDFIGEQLAMQESFGKKQAEEIKLALNTVARQGMSHLPLKIKWIAVKMMLLHHMKPQDAVVLYNRYIGDWGGKVTTYRLEAIKDGKVVSVIRKEPVREMSLETTVSHTQLIEEQSYDVAAVRICCVDQNKNLMPYAAEPLTFETEGPIEVIGPEIVSLSGGMTGTYIRTMGQAGEAALYIRSQRMKEVKITFRVEIVGKE